jgi:hypothetical protein
MEGIILNKLILLTQLYKTNLMQNHLSMAVEFRLQACLKLIKNKRLVLC